MSLKQIFKFSLCVGLLLANQVSLSGSFVGYDFNSEDSQRLYRSLNLEPSKVGGETLKSYSVRSSRGILATIKCVEGGICQVRLYPQNSDEKNGNYVSLQHDFIYVVHVVHKTEIEEMYEIFEIPETNREGEYISKMFLSNDENLMITVSSDVAEQGNIAIRFLE